MKTLMNFFIKFSCLIMSKIRFLAQRFGITDFILYHLTKYQQQPSLSNKTVCVQMMLH